jgi:GH18 family chitinase
MALLCQKIQTAVKALDPTYEVHLTIIPPLSQADPDLKISTALACQGYVDQINIMTYDDPNNLDQSPYQPGNATVYNHTGVGRSVQSVQWFLDQGVTRDKLGMGIAGYGRNSASGQAFTNNGTPYDQIVRIAGSGGAVDPQFMLGRLNAAVPIVNPNPTSQGNFYYSPTTAVWGFDSVDTIADKVQASSNLGIRAVFMWQLSNDYSNPASVLPAGNPLANFALVKGAQAAIAAL